MSSSFAYEDPLLRQSLSTQQKARAIFKEMGQGMYKSGKGFGKVGALFAGIECVIESVSFVYPFFVNASFLWECMLLQVSSTKRHGQPCCRWFRRWRHPRTKRGSKSGRWRWSRLRCVLGSY